MSELDRKRILKVAAIVYVCIDEQFLLFELQDNVLDENYLSELEFLDKVDKLIERKYAQMNVVAKHPEKYSFLLEEWNNLAEDFSGFLSEENFLVYLPS